MPVCHMQGKPLPSCNFAVFGSEGWEDWKLADMVKGKTVIIFGLPGAFTPTCSTSHLPRYDELFPVFLRAGVDDVLCTSVNDTFVMNAWAAAHKIQHVKMLPDGNGDFAKAMGLNVDKSAIGFGERSWRYSMLVRNGTIEKIFLEPEEGADPYGQSDADTMLKYVAPKAQPPPRIALLSKEGCRYCMHAKEALKARQLAYVDIPLPDWNRGVVVGAITGKSSVPQVFIDGKLIGGSEELDRWLATY